MLHLEVNIRRRHVYALLGALALIAAMIPVATWAADQFDDVPNDNVFHDDITWLADAGVTKGCNPPANTEFCPGSDVTREQMAAFMHRLAVNQVVDAATAIDSEQLGGQSATNYQRVFSIASGDLSLGTGLGSIPALTVAELDSITITAPAAGALIINATSSWDSGGYILATWAEVDEATACDVFADGDVVSGTTGADMGGSGGFPDTGGDSNSGQAQTAGMGAIEVAAGVHEVSLCIYTLGGGATGTNLGYSLSAEWLPSGSVDIAADSPAVKYPDAEPDDNSLSSGAG